MRLVNSLPSAATRIFIVALLRPRWVVSQVSHCTRPSACAQSNLDQLEGIVALLLALVGQAARLADHACRSAVGMCHRVVMAAVQVAVQPQGGTGQQPVVGVAEAGRAALLAVARVGTAQARREV